MPIAIIYLVFLYKFSQLKNMLTIVKRFVIYYLHKNYADGVDLT